MNSNELLCEAGLEHDFNCLIVKCIFGKGGRCQTRLVEDAAFFESDDFHTSNGRSLCV